MSSVLLSLSRVSFFSYKTQNGKTRNPLIRTSVTVKLSLPLKRLTMASISRSRRPLEARSGGKMVRPRRTIAPKTPYDRPTPQFSNPPRENPNWISRLILSPTRMAVNGAGKLLSAVFYSPDSYSSSSSSDFGSVSAGAIEDDYGTNDVSSQSADILEKRNGAPRMIESFSKDCQPIIEKDNSKHVIEQLLMQETFTRKECNKLIKIIKSRVVDHHATEDQELLYKTVGDTDKHDLCSTAIMEARKWLTEKKVESASKSDVDNVVEDEMGSPVDMAKSFMRKRPLWESPSFKHGELESSSPLLAQLPQIESPYFIRKIVSKPKRDTPTTGSWNIQEEIQRVRAKATENMLMNLPSKRIDCSVADIEKNICTNSFISQSIKADMKDNMQSSRENADTSLCTTAEKSISHELQVLESTQDGLQNEASPDDVNVITQKSQDLDATQITNGKGGPKDILEDLGSTEFRLESSQDVTIMSHRDSDVDVLGHEDTNAADQQLSTMGEENMEEPISQERNCSMSKEVTGSRIDYTANGFPSLVHRLTSEVANEHNDLQIHEEHNLASSIDNMATGGHGDETCEFLTETSVEIPNWNDTVDENGSIASGSQNGLGEDNELPRVRTRPTSKRSPANKASDLSKPRANRLTRYSRRNRGRGK